MAHTLQAFDLWPFCTYLCQGTDSLLLRMSDAPEGCQCALQLSSPKSFNKGHRGFIKVANTHLRKQLQQTHGSSCKMQGCQNAQQSHASHAHTSCQGMWVPRKSLQLTQWCGHLKLQDKCCHLGKLPRHGHNEAGGHTMTFARYLFRSPRSCIKGKP